MNQFTHQLLFNFGIRDVLRSWAMVHKLRIAMGNRDARYTLEGMIELNEGYFTVESSEIEQEKGILCRVAVGKMNTAIMAESTILEDILKKNYLIG